MKMPPVKPNNGSTCPSPPSAVSLFTGYTVNLFREELLVKNPASAPLHCPQVGKGLTGATGPSINHSPAPALPHSRRYQTRKNRSTASSATSTHQEPAQTESELATPAVRLRRPRRCRLRWAFPRSRAQETGNPRDPGRGTRPQGSTDTAGCGPASASRTCLRMAFMTPMKEASSFASSRAASFFSVFFLLLFSDPGAAMLARAHSRHADPSREHALGTGRRGGGGGTGGTPEGHRGEAAAAPATPLSPRRTRPEGGAGRADAIGRRAAPRG